ncbi:MAG TPA: hypothetical protein VLY85_04570, partial [Thermoplasmata archaeon]|nr:hypothetical protein [Thermoplasmata archaeon]
LSLSEIAPRDSRIGLTMRQPGLGRFEWIADAHKKAEPKTSKRPAGGKAPPKPAAAPSAPAAKPPAKTAGAPAAGTGATP